MLNFRGILTKVAVVSNLADVSPFGRQKEQNDLVRNGIFIGVAIVLLVFFGSMIAVLMMHAPPL
jgi:hypothetical protein